MGYTKGSLPWSPLPKKMFKIFVNKNAVNTKRLYHLGNFLPPWPPTQKWFKNTPYSPPGFLTPGYLSSITFSVICVELFFLPFYSLLPAPVHYIIGYSHKFNIFQECFSSSMKRMKRKNCFFRPFRGLPPLWHSHKIYPLTWKNEKKKWKNDTATNLHQIYTRWSSPKERRSF